MSQRLIVIATTVLLAFPAYAQTPTNGQPKAAPTEQKAAPPPSQPASTPATKVGADQITTDPKTGAGTDTKPVPPKFSPNNACVTSTSDEDFRVELKDNSHAMGEAVVVGSRYLPTGQRVDIGIRRSYTDGLRYFAAYQTSEGYRRIFDKGEVITRRAIPSDSLVKAKLLNADETIVTLELDSDDPGWWRKATLYVYTCLGSPTRVSQTNIILSPYRYSLWFAAIGVVVAYGLLGFLLGGHGNTFQGFFGALSPARLSAGPDGKGSLAKFQVLGFSLLVFALLLLLLLQTGELSDLNVTILGLLGINGFGATLAKGADGSRNVLTPDNRAWLLQHNWLSAANQQGGNSQASWRDFFTTDGEFDVYRCSPSAPMRPFEGLHEGRISGSS